jgi:hypothetical protein
VGEDARQDPTGPPPAERVSVPQAADHLGTTVDAIRKRVQRGTIPHEKDAAGRVWILLDTGRPRQDTIQDTTGQRQDGESGPLISEMRSRIQFLEDELQRKDAILLNMTEAMKALSPPPQEASSEPRESPETVEEESERTEPRPATVESQESVQRPWWRRVFGR